MKANTSEKLKKLLKTKESLNNFKILRAILICLNLFCTQSISAFDTKAHVSGDELLDPDYLENFEREHTEKGSIIENKFDSKFRDNLAKKQEQEEAIKEENSIPQGDIDDGKETGGLLKSSILLFGVTFAGITIAKSCLKKASSATFLASATAYITAEIALFGEFYHDGKKALQSYQANKYDKRQFASLEEASRRADRAAKVALAKTIIQSVAATGFAVASILAITEAAVDFPKFTGDCFSTGIFPETQIQFLVQSLFNALIPNAKAKAEFGTIGPLLAGIVERPWWRSGNS